MRTLLLLLLAGSITMSGLADVGTPPLQPAPSKEKVAFKTDAPLEAVPSWLDYSATPLTNPVWFEDARITSEVRPIFLYHVISDDFATQGGDVQVYALQARYALTDKLAIIAVKDGLVAFNPDAGDAEFGIADIAAGLKYQAYRNDEWQLLVTPGLTFEIPIGNSSVFQGNGDGTFQPFVSVLKGFDRFQVAGNLGAHIPVNFEEETAQLHYSLHAHYEISRYFIPLVELNGFTVLSSADRMPLDSEGADLINFGSSGSEGKTSVNIGVGFRSKVWDHVELGVAWEKQLTDGDTVFDQRVTADVVYRF